MRRTGRSWAAWRAAIPRSCRSASARIESQRISSPPRSSKRGSPPVAVEPTRSATLVVDLDALARNFAKLCRAAAPAQCAAVVKADAYGLGVERIAKRLLQEGCRRLFVATAGEARELRA